MNDETLNKIEQQLEEINAKTPTHLTSVLRGFLTGFGYVIGAGVAIILIGWFLTIVGVIPAFTKQANEWKTIFQKNQNQTFVPVDNAQDNTVEQ